jgi:hypothetical protein
LDKKLYLRFDVKNIPYMNNNFFKIKSPHLRAMVWLLSICLIFLGACQSRKQKKNNPPLDADTLIFPGDSIQAPDTIHKFPRYDDVQPMYGVNAIEYQKLD